MRDIPDDNLRYPVLITTADSTGSGFFINSDKATYLVSAKHVLADRQTDGSWQLKTGHVEVLFYPQNLAVSEPSVLSIDLGKLSAAGHVRLHKDYDVCALKLGDVAASKEIRLPDSIRIKLRGPNTSIVGLPRRIFKKFDEVLVANEVFVFGYPNSLGTEGQIDYSKPLLRKGITAGKNEKNRTIILDCPTYFGNSGGLVLQREHEAFGYKVYAIGIVSEFVPFIERLHSLQYGTENVNIENSGYSIAVPIDTIEQLLGDEKAKMNSPEKPS